MKSSIVQRLDAWISLHAPRLEAAGIEIIRRIPAPNSDVPWKGGVGMIKDEVIVSFTVWERTVLQTELIIVDGASGETLLSIDSSPSTIEEIDPVLSSVAGHLIAGTYRR